MPIPAEAIDLLLCSASVDPEKGSKLEALISKGVDWNLVCRIYSTVSPYMVAKENVFDRVAVG